VSVIIAELVAESSTDRDLVATFGTAAAENSGTGFGLHAAEKTVGLGTVAAVGLKSALGHGTGSDYKMFSPYDELLV